MYKSIFLGFKMDLSFCDSILVMESKFIPWQELRWFLGPALDCGSPLNQSQWELDRGVAPVSSSPVGSILGDKEHPQRKGQLYCYQIEKNTLCEPKSWLSS